MEGWRGSRSHSRKFLPARARTSSGRAARRLRKLFFVEDVIERDIRLALVLVLEALVESVQATALRILFDLPIPSGGVKFSEPRAKLGKIVAGEPADRVLNLFDGAHGAKMK